MPRSTLGGDDSDHHLSQKEKADKERRLREEARDLFRQGLTREAKGLVNKAINISRRPSRKAQHH